MTATAHALIGAACAATFTNPVVGLSVAAISHPILDTIPHWDAARGWREKTKTRLFIESSIDLAIGVALAYFLFGSGVNMWYFFGAILASISWDIAELPYWFLKWRFFPFNYTHAFQSAIQGKASMPFGIATQIVTIVIVFIAFKYFG